MLKPSNELLIFIIENYETIIFAIFSIAIIGFLKAWRKQTGRRSNSEDKIPGGLGLPLVGESFSFLSATNSTKGCYDFVRQRRKWYGKCFKSKLFGKIHVFLPSTEAAKIVFNNDFGEFNKGYLKSMANLVGSKSVFALPLESHKRVRQILSPLFSKPSLAKFVENFDQMLCQRLKNLQENRTTFAVLNFATKLTLDSMCKMLLSITEESLLKQIFTDISAVSSALLSIPLMIPGTVFYKGMKARNRLLELFRLMIAKRRSGEEYKDDFLQFLLERDSYSPTEKLDDLEILDNLLTLLLSGQASSSAAMMWSVKFLDDNRQVLHKLREEQFDIMKNMEGNSLSMEDLNKMSYCYKVVKESLRMSNPVLWFPRVAQNDCTLDGFEIKKGWNVNVDATFIHSDPEIYKDPLQFNPSRFDGKQKPYSFIPFGAGPRTCQGIEMAKLSMLVFLHRLTSEYEWKIEDNDPSLEKTTHVPRLKSGLPITLKPLK